MSLAGVVCRMCAVWYTRMAVLQYKEGSGHHYTSSEIHYYPQDVITDINSAG